MPKVIYYGYLKRGYLNSIKAVLGIIVIIVEIIVSQCTKNENQQQIIIYLIVNFIFIICILVDVIAFFKQSRQTNYGPLMIINGNQTQIHWYTKQKQISAVILEDKTYQDDAKTNFHNILVKEQKFQFKVNAISDKSFNYFLPEIIQKFVVLSDVHNNGSYLEQMDSNYDFSLLCGDYSYGGKAHEFAKAFRGMHMKPVIMAVGNHDALGDVNELVCRETNFYQKIGQNGFFFLYVLNQNILHHCHLNKARVDNAIKFLSDNMQLSENDENVFIVSHQTIYSTGEFGSIEYFTKKMEDFIDSHPTSKIRAIFSGHDHVFSSFKKIMFSILSTGLEVVHLIVFLNGATEPGIVKK
ncbi:Calcineurin-like_phosphoesterase domain-containing protein [Hexamita inflata]|uniref:Calcineurin-like phosphoesterase domain-containing protein n=1 Tax=Hexamita inflata TaxID=28002 RepID=A0AA86PDI0_9EUKA|nr:Calcineurin-like phosphoesterase domain-containing protein [Hexamita inflata]